MMLKGKKSDYSAGFVNFELDDKTFEDMNSSFSSKVIPQRLVMSGIENDLINLLFKNISQNRILFAGLVNFSSTFRMNEASVAHSSNISSTEFNLMKGPFFLSLSSLTDSSFNGNSSTGCQSILSQNSQSSSEIFPVCLYLSNMSRFINLTTALDMNFKSNLGSFNFNSTILSSPEQNNENSYLKVSDENEIIDLMKLVIENEEKEIYDEYEFGGLKLQGDDSDNDCTLYVDINTGSDSYDGKSESRAFKTIQKAADVVKAGDVVCVKEGTYREEFYNGIPGGESWEKPVTLKAYPNHKVVLKPENGASRVFTFASEDSKYIIIDGFVLDAANVKFDAIKNHMGNRNRHVPSYQNSKFRDKKCT